VKKLSIHIITIVAAMLCSCLAVAQPDVYAKVKLDTNKIRIGEQVKLQLIFGFQNEAKRKIVWPETGDTIRKEIEVIVKEKPVQKKTGNTTEITQELVITSFDSGFWVIPPFKFFLKDDTIPLTETEPLLLEVHTVPTDTSETSIRDIKPIFEEKWDWKAYLPYIYWGIGILAVLGIIITILILTTRKNKATFTAPKVPLEPPHITALRSLETIREQKAWKEGKYKEYYTAITDVLRIYIEGRFKVAAMELTTDEILHVMRTQVIDMESKRKLQQVLELADYVKFAKVIPIEPENEITLNHAFDFVNGTSREEKAEDENSDTTEKIS
jgi:hypothetical protein